MNSSDVEIEEKEFLLFSIPYAYFIGACSYRLHLLKRRSLSSRPSAVSIFENDNTIHYYPPSLVLKIMATAWICTICTLSMILGFFGLIIETTLQYYLVWIIPIIAQIMAIYLLNVEYQLQEHQQIWTHRLFWPIQSAFLGVRMFQSYQTLLSDFLILLQFLPSLLLLVYGLYRPDDRKNIPMDIPRVIWNLFRELESKIRIQKPSQISNEIPLLHRVSERKNSHNYQQYLDMLNENESNKDQEIFIKEKLPERDIFINKKLNKRFINDNEIIYSYIITTVIEEKQFESEKRYQELINLERIQKEILTRMNQMPLRLERIELMVGEDEYSYVQRRREIIEFWLKEQLKNPEMITQQLLEFLNVDQESQTPFIVYQTFMLNRLQNKKQKKKQNSDEEIGKELDDFQIINQDHQNINNNNGNGFLIIDYKNLNFKAGCSQYQYGQFGPNSVEYIINIKYIDKNQEHKYRLIKTMSEIKQFEDQLEQCIGRSIPQHIKIPKNLSKLELNEKVLVVDQFFKQLLKNQEFYSTELFDFICFDLTNNCPID